MNLIVSLICSLAVFQSLAAGASIPNYFERSLTTRQRLDTQQVRAELGRRVSKETSIFGPDDQRYSDATSRWNNYAVRQIQVVVSPGRESDVSTIVSTKMIIRPIFWLIHATGQILQREQY